LLKALDELGIRQRHHRDLHDGQWSAREQLAGRRNDTVPQREKHQLGRRLPGTLHDPLPGRIKPDQVSNEIVSGLDWLPTLMALGVVNRGDNRRDHPRG
jgi:arylsulfatase A-like enzyme